MNSISIIKFFHSQSFLFRINQGRMEDPLVWLVSAWKGEEPYPTARKSSATVCRRGGSLPSWEDDSMPGDWSPCLSLCCLISERATKEWLEALRFVFRLFFLLCFEFCLLLNFIFSEFPPSPCPSFKIVTISIKGVKDPIVFGRTAIYLFSKNGLPFLRYLACSKMHKTWYKVRNVWYAIMFWLKVGPRCRPGTLSRPQWHFSCLC